MNEYFEKVIITGTAIMDFDYLNYIKNFWIYKLKII